MVEVQFKPRSCQVSSSSILKRRVAMSRKYCDMGSVGSSNPMSAREGLQDPQASAPSDPPPVRVILVLPTIALLADRSNGATNCPRKYSLRDKNDLRCVIIRREHDTKKGLARSENRGEVWAPAYNLALEFRVLLALSSYSFITTPLRTSTTPSANPSTTPSSKPSLSQLNVIPICPTNV